SVFTVAVLPSTDTTAPRTTAPWPSTTRPWTWTTDCAEATPAPTNINGIQRCKGPRIAAVRWRASPKSLGKILIEKLGHETQRLRHVSGVKAPLIIVALAVTTSAYADTAVRAT